MSEPIEVNQDVIDEADRIERGSNRPETPEELVAFIEERISIISKCCAPWLNPKTLIATFNKMVLSNPEVVECTLQSIVLQVMNAGSIGVNPTGVRNSSAWVIRKINVAPKGAPKNYQPVLTLMVGYGDLVRLMKRSGDIVSIEPEVIFEGEKYELQMGMKQDLKHTPDPGIRAAENRKIILGYCVVGRRDGSKSLTIIDEQDIKFCISASGSKGGYGPWLQRKRQMVQKSVLIQAAKWELLDDYASKAIEISNDGDGYDFANTNARRIPQQVEGSEATRDLDARIAELRDKREEVLSKSETQQANGQRESK